MYHITKNGGGDGGGGGWCLNLWTEVNSFVDKDQKDR